MHGLKPVRHASWPGGRLGEFGRRSDRRHRQATSVGRASGAAKSTPSRACNVANHEEVGARRVLQTVHGRAGHLPRSMKLWGSVSANYARHLTYKLVSAWAATGVQNRLSNNPCFLTVLACFRICRFVCFSTEKRPANDLQNLPIHLQKIENRESVKLNNRLQMQATCWSLGAAGRTRAPTSVHVRCTIRMHTGQGAPVRPLNKSQAWGCPSAMALWPSKRCPPWARRPLPSEPSRSPWCTSRLPTLAAP